MKTVEIKFTDGEHKLFAQMAKEDDMPLDGWLKDLAMARMKKGAGKK
jgi:hypothetical protein